MKPLTKTTIGIILIITGIITNILYYKNPPHILLGMSHSIPLLTIYFLIGPYLIIRNIRQTIYNRPPTTDQIYYIYYLIIKTIKTVFIQKISKPLCLIYHLVTNMFEKMFFTANSTPFLQFKKLKLGGILVCLLQVLVYCKSYKTCNRHSCLCAFFFQKCFLLFGK